ncbi:ABC transporter substrate-binding protein [Massilia sp. TSP1-1-2]|uniref:ABC transporter substrate-binding protein n=1 Tax=unclassified Massilia TaxID=2609279 RepID=UPI003CF410DF
MKLSKRATFLLCTVAALAIGALLFGLQRKRPAAPLLLVRVAIPVQLAAGSMFTASEQKLFAQQGLQVELKRFLLGKQALQAVLDGSADLALVADTPFMHAVLRGERIAALATVFESRKTMAIVARRDAGITTAAALKGKRVGTVVGTNAEFFLDTLLDVNDIARADVDVQSLGPGQLVAALEAGKVDAVTVWHPDLAHLNNTFGAKAVTLYGEDIFVYRVLLVGKLTYIAQHQAELRSLLAAIKASNSYIAEQPEQARAAVGAAIGVPPAQLAQAFNPADYTLVLDQSLLIALSAQERWAIAKGAVPAVVPTYLDFIRPEPLRAVVPDADRIIR